MEISLETFIGPELITPTVFRDDRGYFFESYHREHYLQNGVNQSFIQDNVAYSKKHAIRGMHYQSDPGQAKLIYCLKGKIFDVIVDVQPESENFGNWASIILDDQNFKQLFIPVGFAHGYCVLSDEAVVQYKVSTYYHPDTECSIRWDDPTINIDWPCNEPILSQRDQTSPFFNEIFQ